MVEVQGEGSSSDCAPVGPENASAIAGYSILLEFKGLIFVRYLDHVMYNRTPALAMKPQVRETVGWLVYECEYYITITWDRDADPPTLKGGDPKASGLVLLKSDILQMKKLPLQEISEWLLNSGQVIVNDEYALSATRSEKLSPKTNKRKGQK
jgi:hypothetical protein